MARPTKYTPETVEKILNALRVGATRRAACGAAGVHEDTFGVWLRRKSGFSDSVTRAESECELRFTARITRESNEAAGDWKSALEWLKRRRREDWGDHVDIDLDKRITELLATVAAQGQTQAP